ncbi:MAG: hypothetical protein CVV24_04625 [Ignavibacteriae bacterium HGW-Ignavibacteriae-3]|nr:MAG: hypothetical protein CVV24_04625 [Ignavibacteriae bacterium HGW-Ignavibacteriae-3]
MIHVTIESNAETFVIRLKHKIDFVVERRFQKTKPLNRRTISVFVQLFFSVAKLIFKELFTRPR